MLVLNIVHKRVSNTRGTCVLDKEQGTKMFSTEIIGSGQPNPIHLPPPLLHSLHLKSTRGMVQKRKCLGAESSGLEHLTGDILGHHFVLQDNSSIPTSPLHPKMHKHEEMGKIESGGGSSWGRRLQCSGSSTTRHLTG